MEKTLARDKQSSKSSILGSGYQYFTVILLIALESMHNLHVFPPFLEESKAGVAQGLMLSCMTPFLLILLSASSSPHLQKESSCKLLGLESWHLEIDQFDV